MKCPACGSEGMIELVPGIYQCTACRKIVRGKKEAAEKDKETAEFIDGKWFMRNTSLNEKWDVCEIGIKAFSGNDRMLAVLFCHDPMLPSLKYVRISWFKGSNNRHDGMIKIGEKAELDNIIRALEMIDSDFDENFNYIGGMDKGKIMEAEGEDSFYEEEKNSFDLNKKLCPSCGNKMVKGKGGKYYYCDFCGEMVVLEDGMPIFNIPTEKIELKYSSNFPVNYYEPYMGITVKWHMEDWKALVIVYDKDKPEKKWLRFYWWERNIREYLSGGGFGTPGSSAKWKAKKGSGRTNIYSKEQLRALIEALKKIKNKIGW